MTDVELNIPCDEEKQTLDNVKKKDSETVPSVEKLEYWRQFTISLQATSIRGLSRALTRKKRKYQVYWITVFFFAVIVFIINLKNITARYLSDPILTQLEREDKPFIWPHFTFCSPANPIPFWNDKQLLKKWKNELTKAENNYSSLPKYDPRSHRKIWEHYMAVSSINPKEFYSQLVNHSIYKLSVIYEDSSLVEYSSPSDLYHRVDNFEDAFDVWIYTIRSPIACLTLLPEKLRRIVAPLKNNHTLIGIKMYLIMDLMSYMSYDIGFESRKLYFYVTNPNTTILLKFPNYILPGTDTTFLMKQKVHKRITHCSNETFHFELFDIGLDKTANFKGDYDDCRSWVSQREFVKKCGCFNPYLPIYKLPGQKPILCTNMTIYNREAMAKNIDCLNSVIKNNNDSSYFVEVVKNECSTFQGIPCVESTYSVSRYTTTWQETMSPTRKQYMINESRQLPNAPPNASKSFPSENLAIVKLEWARTKTEVTFEQYDYPFSRYVSDFGGIVGLWIGLSVFSIFEFLEVVYKFIKYTRAK